MQMMESFSKKKKKFKYPLPFFLSLKYHVIRQNKTELQEIQRNLK